jgi:hypothetical protein
VKASNGLQEATMDANELSPPRGGVWIRLEKAELNDNSLININLADFYN